MTSTGSPWTNSHTIPSPVSAPTTSPSNTSSTAAARRPPLPHSVELRILVETGLLGALIALAGFGASLLASARAIRRTDPMAAT